MVFTLSTRYYCQILMKPESVLHIFERYSNIKYHEIRPVGAEMFQAD
jgi:hypothetical protein